MAGLLCLIVTDFLSSRQSELCAEMLGWMLLPIVLEVARRSGSPRDRTTTLVPSSEAQRQPASKTALWVVALGVGIVSLSKAENGMIGFLQPALTPLLLIPQKYPGLGREPGIESGTMTITSGVLSISTFSDTIWGTAVVAVLLICTVSDWDPRLYVLSAIPVVALLVVFIILAHNGSRLFRPLDIEKAVLPLSLRVVAVLATLICAETFAFDFPKIETGPILTLGVMKALTWCFMAQTAGQSSWRIVSTAATFSMVATIDPFTYSSDTHAFLHLAGSHISLGQTIHLLPSHPKLKRALWSLSLIPVVVFIRNILDIRAAQSSLIHSQNHPIELLVQNAKLNFEALLKSQSETYPAAHAEYIRRYGVQPPPGFEAWFEYAKLHDSPIIDDFDTLYRAISPFWGQTGKEFLDVMDRAYNARDSELWLCEFSGDLARTSCTHPHRTRDRSIQLLFNTALGELRGALPNVKFLVNHLDEPRVIVPPDPSGPGDQFGLTDSSRRSAWDLLTRFCSSQGDQAGHQSQEPYTGSGQPSALAFVTDHRSALDLCRHPEYRAMHGMLLSPATLRLFEGLVPTLSTGSLSTMSDILYPSPAYIEPEFQYCPDHDPPWDQKRNALYWAGSTTGGFVTSSAQWPHFHRQRFVQLAQNLDGRHSYLQEIDGQIHLTKSPFLNGRLFDVAFTKTPQCEPQYCRQQRSYFRLKPWAHRDLALHSRLVFDTDGNGISGRFYKLLASNSAVLKQTLMREWHDDRLLPWVHYLPVSLGLEELPEMVSYLTSTEAGRMIAAEIAGSGRGWFETALREVDRSVYLYRLLLEIARLQDPERMVLC
ncbi:hypothetical protein BO70DRAFT_339085 [Aspergillus heteromorphus CBS 117.55]|uniref:Glycosyl transferase CAP10 domain-containing protein n=1 Tax=Aspergillus heteromorphus CBS 117.55 TaxID=1448321 RepID=A0A317VSS6_9EURO|nr:uncharacterized protein BO70DRAFT_339085 [Aspergillus heteromorphus CBS 117.55]PWY77383.1 hypothetical protein BO70DRAFT_339085 [Aspergillus heteromorphus CBS 117.55]